MVCTMIQNKKVSNSLQNDYRLSLSGGKKHKLSEFTSSLVPVADQTSNTRHLDARVTVDRDQSTGGVRPTDQLRRSWDQLKRLELVKASVPSTTGEITTGSVHFSKLLL